jgi:hypothetical protein
MTPTNRANLLSEIQILPPDAFISSEHAAAFLDTTAPVLANWRSQKRGPKFYGNGAFIRYRVTDLVAFMNERAGEQE